MWTLHKVKILSGLLFAALAMNVALGAHIAGERTGQWQRGKHQHERLGAAYESIKSMPKPERERAKSIMRSHKEAMRESGKTVREQRKKVTGLLKQDPLDKAQLQTELEQLKMLSAMAVEQHNRFILDMVDILPADKRSILLDRPRHPKRAD